MKICDGCTNEYSATNEKVNEMNTMFPHDGRWHTVFEEEKQVFVDGIRIWKKDPKSWT
ncbi:hypothetical protein [Candidatus Nitrosotalea sp. TS]|uniref:hypothetical protein n=1 Tax=Candidatus Nitrosotalea sp. TS TaxID=2341020 RepID=UPI00210352A1|nr:hypothetical protein [Candidatus Nitrosotalea sp. TS]